MAGRKKVIGFVPVWVQGLGKAVAMPVEVQWERHRTKQYLKKLSELKKGQANRIAKQGLRAGMRIVAKEIKKGLPAYAAKGSRRTKGKGRVIKKYQPKMRIPKKNIGSRAGIAVRKNEGKRGSVVGKAGSGVGKSLVTGRERNRPRGGAGLSVRNMHWYLIGTKKRRTGAGLYTGRMRKVNMVNKAFKRTKAQAMRRTRMGIKNGLERYWAKRKIK